MAPVIRTARLVLRMPQAGDLSAYAAYCASDRSHFVHGPFTAAQAFDKFSAMIGHWTLRGFGRYVITLDGAAIGHAGPLALDDNAAPELTWTLWDAAHEGQGLSTEAAEAVATHLLDEAGWDGFIIRVLPDNFASRRVAEKLGARLTEDAAPDWYPGALTYRLERASAA